MGVESGFVGTFGFGLAVGCQRLDGLFASCNLFIDRRLYGTVGLGVAIEDIVDARHIAVDIIRCHKRQGVGHLQLQRGLILVGIVGLTEGIHPGDGSQSLILTAIIEGLHCSEFHGLYLTHALG